MTDNVACFLIIGCNILMSQAEKICDLFEEHEFLDKDELLEDLLNERNIHAEEVRNGDLNEEIKKYLISQGISFQWYNNHGYSVLERNMVYCAETNCEYQFPTIEGEVVLRYKDINDAELLTKLKHYTAIIQNTFGIEYMVATTGHEQVALAAEQQKLTAQRALRVQEACEHTEG